MDILPDPRPVVVSGHCIFLSTLFGPLQPLLMTDLKLALSHFMVFVLFCFGLVWFVSFWGEGGPIAEVMAGFCGVMSAQALVVLSVYFLDSV